ncbi:hypothetical protein LX73_0694 [Fodinibius salinus]|uniref:Uncharacterized protein n=1 Tax=Fodinibius salinus TaxID=860790 RepID=A0A5D3YQX2_9BACT|nr:hypothetical protein [Fodinibius salinus]TYP95393.1 hypothetical protein LX73_0694 [Fodinibius salinus]
MSKHNLTKVEALKLIVPVVDGEATADERQAFMDFIADHPDVRNKYESMKNTKSLLSSRCPCETAPDSLKKFVNKVCNKSSAEKETENSISNMPDRDPKQPSSKSYSSSDGNLKKLIFGVAASVLFLIAGWQLFSFFNSSPQQPSYNIEEYAYRHFNKHNGNYVEPTINTASLGNAEITLAADYNMPMTIPSLKNASFKGIVYNEFVPNFKAPMLEYHLPSADEYIYIFAFKIKQLKAFKKLFRNQEAVNTCDRPKDFHVREVEGKHIVSWKWNNVWYAAISNHNGDKLASLVKPLQFSSRK